MSRSLAVHADVPPPGGLLGAVARSRALIVFVLILLGLLAWLPGFTTIAPVDRDEPRYAQASKQMLESGDPIDIRLGEDPRYKKPVGIYWLQAGTAALAGGAASPIWVYRLPSLAGALVAVLATAAVGAAMFGRAVGLAAGLALATALILGVEARLAKTDAVLLALVVVMQWALWQLWSRRDAADRGGGWWVVFWAALGAGILVKGPIAPAIAGLTGLTLVLWERRIGWLRELRPLRGALVTLLIAAPWAATIVVASDGAFLAGFKADALGKITAAHEGHGAPPGFYLVGMWATAWPFVALIPLAALWGWRQRSDDRARFLIAWIVPFWVAFELFATKLPHYTLPTYPALAIAAAAAVLSLERRRPWLVGLPLAVVLLLGAGLAVAATVLPFLLDERLPAPVVVGAVAAVFLLWAVWRAYAAGRHQRAGLAMLASALVLYATVHGALFPRLEALRLSEQMAQAARTHSFCPDTPIATVGYHEPSALFLVGTELRLATVQEAAELLASEPCALVFVDERHQDAWLAAVETSPRALASLTGWRLNGGRWTTLTLYGAAD